MDDGSVIAFAHPCECELFRCIIEAHVAHTNRWPSLAAELMELHFTPEEFQRAATSATHHLLRCTLQSEDLEKLGAPDAHTVIHRLAFDPVACVPTEVLMTLPRQKRPTRDTRAHADARARCH